MVVPSRSQQHTHPHLPLSRRALSAPSVRPLLSREPNPPRTLYNLP